MNTAKILGDPQTILLNLCRPFFREAAEPLYVAACCDRIYVGRQAPKICRSCKRVPNFARFETETDIDFRKVPDQLPLLTIAR